MTPKEILSNINEITLKKAQKIYLEKKITNIKFSGNIFSSTVNEDIHYHQKIEVLSGQLVNAICSCQDESLKDLQICSHLSALLMVIRDFNLYRSLNRKKMAVDSFSESDITRKELISLLEKANKEELLDFILSLRSYYKEIPDIIRKTFINTGAKDFLEVESAKLNSFTEKLNKDKKENVLEYLNFIKELHGEAKDYRKNRSYFRSLIQYLLLFESTLRYDLGIDHLMISSQYLTLALDAIKTLAPMKYSSLEKKIIFQHIHRLSEDYPAHPEMISLMYSLEDFVKTEEDFSHFYELILSININMKEKSMVNELLYLEYRLLKRGERENEAKELLNANKDVPGFLMIKVKELFEKRDFKKAEELKDLGIEKSKSNVKYLIMWYSLLAENYRKYRKYHQASEYLIKLIELGEYNAYLQLKKFKDFKKYYTRIKNDSLITSNPKGVYQKILQNEKDIPAMNELIGRFPHMIKEYFDFIAVEDEAAAVTLTLNYVDILLKQINVDRIEEDLATLVEKLFMARLYEDANRLVMKIIEALPTNIFLRESFFQLKNKYTNQNIYKPE